MSPHGQHAMLDLGDVIVADFDTVDIGDHRQQSLPEGEVVHVESREGDGHRVHNQMAQPLAHRARIAEDPLEQRCHGLEVDQRLIDVEDQHRGRARQRPVVCLVGLC
jgi:hypothetical protein